MIDIDEIIKGLKKLELSTYPVEEVNLLINKIGLSAHIVVTFHRGKSILRARPNYNYKRFLYKSQLSYRPQVYNSTYQRASTPNKSMFYGCIIPDKLEQGELDNPRVVASIESVPWIRDKTKSGYQKISYSRWIVRKDINLIAVVFKDSYYKESSFTRELVNAYKEFIKFHDEKLIERSLKIQDFLAHEFSKEDIENDYDYLISAIFSEYCVNHGFDGIIYPSVRVGGQGFNVAISPRSCNNLRLYAAGESSIYKRKDHMIIGNDTIMKYRGNKEKIKYKKIRNNRMEILDKLGVKNISELKKAQ